MPTINAGASAAVSLPAGDVMTGTGAGSATYGIGGFQALVAGDAWQIGPFNKAVSVSLSASSAITYTVGDLISGPTTPADFGLSASQVSAVQALVSGDWNSNQQAVIDAGGGLVVADDAGNLTGPGGAILGGGGGGASAFADLTDKATADLPVINTPLGSALAAKAPLASPTFTGTVGGITKAMVGLGSVDNTADTAKPVSTAQTTAFAVLGPYADTAALQTAKPAASNGGRVALVGASAPYSAYVSNGTAWLLFDNNSDPLVTVASSGSSVSQAATNLSVLNITLTANTTLGFTSIPAGTWSITLILRQDATGSRLVSWPANTKWAVATAPTLSTAASAVDVVTLMTIDGGTTWFGFLGGKGMA